MAVIRMPEIERIFSVLDRLGISREAVVIPLKKQDPGGVRSLPDGKLEIVVPESTAVDAWVADLEPMLEKLIEG
jgi:hypothetical protein